MWETDYALCTDLVGIIGAIGPNAIGAGIGALIGGWLCDRLGRKTIYQWDMLVYAVGMALLVFAAAPWMIFAGLRHRRPRGRRGYSGELVADRRTGPRYRRGKHSGVAQVLWYLGPVVVLLMSLALTGARQPGSADRVRAPAGDRAGAHFPALEDEGIAALGGEPEVRGQRARRSRRCSRANT